MTVLQPGNVLISRWRVELYGEPGVDPNWTGHFLSAGETVMVLANPAQDESAVLLVSASGRTGWAQVRHLLQPNWSEMYYKSGVTKC